MPSQGPGCTSAARKLGGRRLDPPSAPGDTVETVRALSEAFNFGD